MQATFNDPVLLGYISVACSGEIWPDEKLSVPAFIPCIPGIHSWLTPPRLIKRISKQDVDKYWVPSSEQDTGGKTWFRLCVR